MFRLMLIAAQLLAGCGDKPTNTGLPPPLQSLSAADADAGSAQSQTLWANFAAALGIGNNQAATSPELKAQLATPSSYLAAPRAKEYADLVGRIAQGYAATAFATRCAQIEGLQVLGGAKLVDPVAGTAADFAGAKLYLMRYKLQADATGKAEATARSGLVVIPTAGTANSPILAYAHGGDFGLGYGEVAAAFGAFQGNHVIVAPTFPGEALCKVATDPAVRGCDAAGILVPPTGAQAPYDGDVDELLGMYDCVVRATIGKADGPITGAAAGATLAAALAPLVKRHDGGTFAALPQGLLVGSSRGGLVASLALAKTGAALSVLAAATTPEPLGPAYLSPAYFSCAALVSAPASFAFAEFRLFLEQWVKGRLVLTSFAAFPGMAGLGSLFDAYHSGTADAEAAALALARRDATLTAPLAVGALRDWARFDKGTSGGGQGAYLLVHGVLDRVVPFSQAQVGYNVLLGAATNAAIVDPANPAKAPGLAMTMRGINAKAAYLDGATLKGGLLQHGDKAFFDGTAIVPGDFISAKVTDQALPSAPAEGAAAAIAKQLFGDNPTKPQLKATRSYILSGVLQASKLPKPLEATDAAGAAVVHLLEDELSPALILGAWRQGACEAALAK